MYGEFTWWTGVVEDRKDPLKLGRCRVRVLGYHTDNKGIDHIPTSTLPWATPSQPITSAAMTGIGTTPMGPVEGTWVFGFFRDGKHAQDPVMIGTFGGIPEARPNPVLGFNDPKGIYPQKLYLNEPDTNRLARGVGKLPVNDVNGENAPSLQHKRASRQKDVPVALAGDMSTRTSTDRKRASDTIKNRERALPLYEAADWFEPNPRYGGATSSDTKYLSSVTATSVYPHNHVRQSESGHVEEWDDSPSSERLHRFHKTGTFEEIQPDGTRVTKIVKDEYEVTLGLRDVWIKGAVNITIGDENNKSDCRLLYFGDLVQEVYGDYHLNVHGDMRSKILKNEITEVVTDRKIVVNGEDDLFVGKNQVINIADNLTYTIGGNLKETIKKDVDENYGSGEEPGHHTTHVAGKSEYTCGDVYTLTSTKDMKIATIANMHINVGADGVGNLKEEVEGTVTEIYKKTQHTTVTLDVTEIYKAAKSETVTGAVDETYEATWDNATTGDITIESDAQIKIDATGNMILLGLRIDLN